MTLKVAIQGDEASFHDIATNKFFPKNTERVFCNNFADTFRALTQDISDFALCAIENSLYGSITEVYDLLLKNKVYIIGEVYLHIGQCLIGLPGAMLSDILSVYSHPVALAQCEQYLDVNLASAQRLEYHDTAASVELIKAEDNPTKAAIASREAATLYGMAVIAESIETNKHNYTRFVVLSKSKTNIATKSNKTSLIIKTDHTPGALYMALGCFAKRSINLTKIQSRPIVGKAWHYMFYMDVNIGASEEEFIAANKELAQQGCEVTILGSYLGAEQQLSISQNYDNSP